MKLNLPNRNGHKANELIEFDKPIVMVGSNGSGKSRLGVWIEQNNTNFVIHRISAHRALNLPDFAAIKSLEESINELLFGNGAPQYANAQYKLGHKWQNQPLTVLQNDYDKVLTSLFALSAKRDRDYVKACQQDVSEKKLPIPKSVIETLIDIWNDVLPHREIRLNDSKVTVNNKGKSYHGKDMSDGERVSLYLIGQCLSIPTNAILIIDEPELHLHKALMSRLWNKIEEVRNDCKFIYITHDLDFAATRTKACKIWVKTFENENIWTWEEVPEVEDLPERLILEILGSRKPILFVEGDKGSYDFEIYQYVFPDYTIVPRTGASKVIESTKALRANPSLHQIHANGLIDRDYRSNEEIEILRNSGIFVVDVAEIENLLCIPPLLKIVAENQVKNVDETLKRVTDFVINKLKDDFERQVSFRSALEINYKLNAYNQKAVGKDNLKKAINELTSTIDVDEIYNRNTALYQRIIDNNDLVSALKFYTNKGLLPSISPIFSLANKEYANLIIRLLKTERKKAIVEALKLFLPSLAENSEASVKVDENNTETEVFAKKDQKTIELSQDWQNQLDNNKPINKVKFIISRESYERISESEFKAVLNQYFFNSKIEVNGNIIPNMSLIRIMPNIPALESTVKKAMRTIKDNFSQITFTTFTIERVDGETETIDF